MVHGKQALTLLGSLIKFFFFWTCIGVLLLACDVLLFRLGVIQ